jgi:hypothetical protein
MVPRTRQRRTLALAALLLSLLPALAMADEYPPGGPHDTVPYGAWDTVHDYTLRVVNVELDASDLLHAFDPSLPYVADASYVMVQLEATYTGSHTGRPGVDLWFSVTDGERHFDVDDHTCERWPFPPGDVTLQPGETGRFNLCFVLPMWQMMDAEIALVAHTNLITEQWPVPFSLIPPIDDAPDCGCLPPPLGLVLG